MATNDNSHKIRIVLGTMTWGWHAQVKKEGAKKMLETLVDTKKAYVREGGDCDFGKVCIDTARVCK